jgi:hypothetical protein
VPSARPASVVVWVVAPVAAKGVAAAKLVVEVMLYTQVAASLVVTERIVCVVPEVRELSGAVTVIEGGVVSAGGADDPPPPPPDEPPPPPPDGGV